MKKYKLTYWILMPVLVFAILYVYFLPFETKTIYGDDLGFYREHFKLHTFTDWLNCAATDRKFRPVTGIIDGMLIHLTDKHLHGYYVFSILVQTIITVVFAAIIDLLVNAPLFAFFISILIGTSRFALYNITQLYWGGPMEGVAMIFFLWAVYLLMKAFISMNNSSKDNYRMLLYVTAIANMAMYTHERYLVLFPFAALVALFYPFRRRLTVLQKILIVVSGVFSLAINYTLKTYVYGYPFLMGTGGQQLKFSPATASGSLCDGLLSLLQINTGGEMMIGNSFAISELAFEVIAMVLVVCMAAVFVLYCMGLRQKRDNDDGKYASAPIIVFLLVLLFFTIAPAVATIRLEQRWLQAPFSLLILMLVIALIHIKASSAILKNDLFAAFIALFLLSDHNYLYKGAPKMFAIKAEKTARMLKDAAQNGTIKPNIAHLYIEEDWWLFTEWVTQQGYLFYYYQGGTKQVRFHHELTDDKSGYVIPVKELAEGLGQVISVKEDSVTDITARYQMSSGR